MGDHWILISVECFWLEFVTPFPVVVFSHRSVFLRCRGPRMHAFSSWLWQQPFPCVNLRFYCLCWRFFFTSFVETWNQSKIVVGGLEMRLRCANGPLSCDSGYSKVRFTTFVVEWPFVVRPSPPEIKNCSCKFLAAECTFLTWVPTSSHTSWKTWNLGGKLVLKWKIILERKFLWKSHGIWSCVRPCVSLNRMHFCPENKKTSHNFQIWHLATGSPTWNPRHKTELDIGQF